MMTSWHGTASNITDPLWGQSSVYCWIPLNMMTSSNGNIFRVTGPLCGEFTGPGEFPTQRPVTRSFDVFFHLCLNKRLNKQQWGWWFETLSWSLWRHSNEKGRGCGALVSLVLLNNSRTATAPVTGEFPAQRASKAEMFPFHDVIMGLRDHNITVSTLCSTRDNVSSRGGGGGGGGGFKVFVFQFLSKSFEIDFRMTSNTQVAEPQHFAHALTSRYCFIVTSHIIGGTCFLLWSTV